MVVYVVGHKNPDTDSVCGALALAELKKNQGIDAKGVVQGKLNTESKFVLERFGIEEPGILEDAAGKEVILVDHSDIKQTIYNLEVDRLLGIVDHHKLGDVQSSNPLEIWAWPVGSSCTVIKGMHDFFDMPVKKDMAGCMLCAILSDTVLFKSSTTTDKDKKAAEELAKIAGVDDMEELGMEMFKAKSDIEGCSAAELLMRDYKDFDMSGKSVGVGQLEVIDIAMLDDIKDDLLEALKQRKEENDLDTAILLLTDIMKEGSEMLIVSDDNEKIAKAFDIEIKDSKAWKAGLMSRKKQVVPVLEKAFG